MPMCSTLRKGPPRRTGDRARAHALDKGLHRRSPALHLARDRLALRRKGRPVGRPQGRVQHRAALRAVHRLPAEQPRPGRLDLAGPRQVQGGVEALKAPGLLGQVQVQAPGVGAQALKARCAFCLKQVDQPAAIFARGGL
jgi:hypothetical protein